MLKGIPIRHSEECRDRIMQELGAKGDHRLMGQVEKINLERQEIKKPESAKDIEELDAMEIEQELEQDEKRIKQADIDMREDSMLDDSGMIGFIDHITMDPVQTDNVLKWNVNNQVNHVRSWDDDVTNMNKVLAKENMVRVMEVYSPERVNGMAEILGLLPGMSLDLSELDVDGTVGLQC